MGTWGAKQNLLADKFKQNPLEPFAPEERNVFSSISRCHHVLKRLALDAIIRSTWYCVATIILLILFVTLGLVANSILGPSYFQSTFLVLASISICAPLIVELVVGPVGMNISPVASDNKLDLAKKTAFMGLIIGLFATCGTFLVACGEYRAGQALHLLPAMKQVYFLVSSWTAAIFYMLNFYAMLFILTLIFLTRQSQSFSRFQTTAIAKNSAANYISIALSIAPILFWQVCMVLTPSYVGHFLDRYPASEFFALESILWTFAGLPFLRCSYSILSVVIYAMFFVFPALAIPVLAPAMMTIGG